MMRQTMLMKKAVDCLLAMIAGHPLPVCSDNDLDVLESHLKFGVESGCGLRLTNPSQPISPAKCREFLKVVQTRMNERAGL